MFGNLFKKKKPEISKEMFGQRVLSRMLLTSAKQSPDLFEELGIEMTFTHYLLYLEYLLFLSKKILFQRYSATDVERIINATIYGLIDFMDVVPSDKKDEVKSMFWAMYYDFEKISEEICSDIGSEYGLQNLAESFLASCGVGKDTLGNMLVFTHLSGFVIHHTGDILNDEIVLL